MKSTRPKAQATGHSDLFQTPAWVLDSLAPFLKRHWLVWEPAQGEGSLVAGLKERGFATVGSDVTSGVDFLKGGKIDEDWDVLVTNPPYSLKDDWLMECYMRCQDYRRFDCANRAKPRKAFALLLPLTALESSTRQAMYRRYGLQVLCFPGRPEFTTPSGKVGGSWFDVAWFTWGLNLPSDLYFYDPVTPQQTLDLPG